MRLSLRWKILGLAILTPLTLAAAALFTVNRDVAEHVDASSLHENLNHSVAVFEAMLATREHALAGGAQVVARDPRFFSLLMLRPGQRDRRFDATVRGMANDFNQITKTDVFEILDRQGRLLASAGNSRSSREARAGLVAQALHGVLTTGVLIEPRAHFQAVAVPVRADGRVVGVLLLGASIGTELAEELRSQMRCQVTFLSGRDVTGTTLVDPVSRQALMTTLARLDLGPRANLVRLGILRVHGHGEFLTLLRRIPGAPPEREQFYVLQREFDPEVAFQNAMRHDMLALAAVALILAIVTGLVFSAQVLGPIHRLVRGAREMEKGNYDLPLAVSTGDELGYLADQFARMRQRERSYVEGLEQVARLKSEFIGIASHELRTPISVLSAYCNLLADGSLGPLGERQLEVIRSMGGHLERLTRVAEDATQLAAVQSERLALNLRPCALEPIVRRAVGEALASGAGRDVNLNLAVGAPEDLVVVDEASLGVAISHLITNAIRFTPDGGRVDVRAGAADGMLVISVADTGIGITPERVDMLRRHDLAVREAAHHKSANRLEFGSSGLGLGLSLARGIVEAHGGSIEIESKPGVGSTFTIVIPLASAQRSAA